MTVKHTRTITARKVKDVMSELGPGGTLRLAKKLRSTARIATANGLIPLVPAAAHEVDAIIKRLEAQLN